MYQLIYKYICGAVEFEVFYSSQDTIILTLMSSIIYDPAKYTILILNIKIKFLCRIKHVFCNLC